MRRVVEGGPLRGYHAGNLHSILRYRILDEIARGGMGVVHRIDTASAKARLQAQAATVLGKVAVTPFDQPLGVITKTDRHGDFSWFILNELDRRKTRETILTTGITHVFSKGKPGSRLGSHFRTGERGA